MTQIIPFSLNSAYVTQIVIFSHFICDCIPPKSYKLYHYDFFSPSYNTRYLLKHYPRVCQHPVYITTSNNEEYKIIPFKSYFLLKKVANFENFTIYRKNTE